MVNVHVPIHFLHEEASPGIKRGGVLNIVRHDIELHAPANAIPDAIEIDLTGTQIGNSIHISAVTLPKGVTSVIHDRDFTIATIAAPAVLAAEEETTEAAPAETTETAEKEGE